MKKITLVLAFIGMITLSSCTVNEVVERDIVDYDTISEVFEVTTSFSSNNNFSRLVTFNPPIYSSDMVLVYRLSGYSNGTDYWKLLPETFYFNDGTLDYKFNYNFTRYDVELYMEGFELWNLSTQITNNQTFRIVVIPAAFTNKSAVDYSDYNATIEMLGYTNSEIKKLD
ncbi:hypothetical protein [uncultured Flavobacterium sp.]|uniref:hypothetical protein n=1 Tax=uncultured Flavobacterium sp. TaxID=165435 RepID=UPI0030C7C32F